MLSVFSHQGDLQLMFTIDMIYLQCACDHQ